TSCCTVMHTHLHTHTQTGTHTHTHTHTHTNRRTQCDTKPARLIMRGCQGSYYTHHSLIGRDTQTLSCELRHKHTHTPWGTIGCTPWLIDTLLHVTRYDVVTGTARHLK